MKMSTVPVARRNALSDRRRLAISTVGVGLAIALILLLQGLWAGVLAGVSAYPDHVGAALFVREAGTMVLTEGAVPRASAQTIMAVPGVRRADPVIAKFVILDLHGKKEPVSLVGYQPGALGGPWQITSGRAIRGDGEAVIDQSLAADHRIRVGSSLTVQGRALQVVGLSARTRTLIGGGFVFTSLDTAGALFAEPHTATFILVQAAPTASLAAAIEARTGLAADRPGAIAAEQRSVYAGVLGRIFDLMIVIAFAAGTLIVALTVYSAIVDHLREYGIAKALGARRWRLFRIVAGQTLMLATLGTLAGFALYLAASRLLVTLRPQFPSPLTATAAGAVILAAAAMALLAAILPTQRVARLDPASVYRE
jgi:putative ABC transport system permease protein